MWREDWNENGYLNLLREILENGQQVSDRTGVGTRSLFAERLRFYLPDSGGFPLLTTKQMHFKSILVELLWMLKGKTTLDYLHKHKITIWDEWADQNGDLGPVYGAQWRNFGGLQKGDTGAGGVDQIRELVHGLKTNPHGRRHVVSAWNPSQLHQMKLPPCHCLFQMYVRKTTGYLDCHMYQRSADIFLGVPFNIASYALLTQIVAEHCGYKPGVLTVSFGDVHLYNNHVEQAKEQLTRHWRRPPKVDIAWEDVNSIFDLEPECFMLHDYDPYPAIKAPVAV